MNVNDNVRIVGTTKIGYIDILHKDSAFILFKDGSGRWYARKDLTLYNPKPKAKPKPSKLLKWLRNEQLFK